MEGLIKKIEIHVEIQDIEKFLDIEVKHHTIYSTTIIGRKQ